MAKDKLDSHTFAVSVLTKEVVKVKSLALLEKMIEWHQFSRTSSEKFREDRWMDWDMIFGGIHALLTSNLDNQLPR